jgi:hypothetical protein
VEIALDRVTAHIDGCWQQPKVGSFLVRQLDAQAAEPTLGAVIARCYVSVLDSADNLAVRVNRVFHEVGWADIPIGEILGDGTPWSWNVAESTFLACGRR